jgi:hypothetical protein
MLKTVRWVEDDGFTGCVSLYVGPIKDGIIKDEQIAGSAFEVYKATNLF